MKKESGKNIEVHPFTLIYLKERIFSSKKPILEEHCLQEKRE